LISPKAPFRLTRSQRRGTSISPPGCCVWGRKEGANSYRNKPLWIDCPPNPVADAHRQTSAALRAKTKQPDLYGRSTTKEPYARSAPSPPPASLSPSQSPGGEGGPSGFIKHRDFGGINDTVRQRLHARRRIGTRAYPSLTAICSLGCFLCVLCAFAVRLFSPVTNPHPPLRSDSRGPLQVLGTHNTVPLVEQVEVPDRGIRWDFCRNFVVLDFGRKRFPLAILPFPQILGEAQLGLRDFHFASKAC